MLLGIIGERAPPSGRDLVEEDHEAMVECRRRQVRGGHGRVSMQRAPQ